MAMTTGCLFIISAPSGAGKTSLVKALLNKDSRLSLSISYTSRPQRTGETNGCDYHFVNEETFRRMQALGEFMESAEVYGNLYGTSQKWINDTIESGQDILLEIDCQGARQVRHFFPQAVGIFVLPPSSIVLKERLVTRDQDPADVIRKRLAAAREEVSHINEFGYVIINDELEKAVNDLVSIVNAERLKRERQIIKYQALIAQLT
ncbi:MAG TPA: guanylate kinase [Nitrosomonas sp.]|uniref:guanylate kinase n=1 Tax=Nitrosomonas sp. TaxID=42353 RepID=UPI000E92DA7F|nr:guanylate kinase [Nitrosomonas sp.]GJL75887.1 MAG: guanylate kinase [Nitrosomonas sp.]HBV21263.1 guanylate kinase [Nitrosomonas sp.]HNP25824.1 guanylate kinase [Nitrosomonas sp.]